MIFFANRLLFFALAASVLDFVAARTAAARPMKSDECRLNLVREEAWNPWWKELATMKVSRTKTSTTRMISHYTALSWTWALGIQVSAYLFLYTILVSQRKFEPKVSQQRQRGVSKFIVCEEKGESLSADCMSLTSIYKSGTSHILTLNYSETSLGDL